MKRLWNTHGSFALSATAIVLACGTTAEPEDNTPDPDEPAVINSFEIETALPVDTGDPVSLAWNVSNATSIRITQGAAEIFSGTSGQGTTASDPITGVTTFTLSAEGGDGATVTATAEITSNDISGIVIQTFSVSETSITSGDIVTMTYEIAGAPQIDSVELTDEDGNSSANGDFTDGDGNAVDPARVAMGSFDIQVIGDENAGSNDTKTFTLRAVGGGTASTAMVNLDIEVALPRITDFQTQEGRLTYALGDVPGIAFEAENADQYRLLFDGTPCTNFANVQDNQQNRVRCPSAVITQASHTFTLEVFNANTGLTDPVSQDLVVSGVTAPMVTSFTVTPDEYWQGSIDAAASWEVADATEVELEVQDPVNMAFLPVEGAPTSLSASDVPFRVEGGQTVQVRLRARLFDGDGNLVRLETVTEEIRATFNEPEPNNDSTTPLLISGDGFPVRGTLDGPNDVDWFAIDVNEGESLWAFSGHSNSDIVNAIKTLSVGCQRDTSLQMFDAAGVALGSVVDDNSVDFQGMMPPTECAEIRGGRHGYAQDMAAGRYYIAVSGTNGATGTYQLRVERATAPPSVANITPINLPEWEVKDVVVYSTDYRDGNTVDPLLITYLFSLPFHDLGMGSLNFMAGFLSIVGASGTPHVVQYDRELSDGLQFLDLPVNVPLFDPGSAGVIGNQGRGLVLAYTVVPSSTNVVTGTAEDYVLAGDGMPGPIIPNAVFPLTADEQVLREGFGDQAVIYDENNPSGMMERDPFPYVASQFQSTMDTYDGVTHAHFSHTFSRTLFNAMGDPLPDPASSSPLEWVVNLRDSNGNGYNIQVFINLQ